MKQVSREEDYLVILLMKGKMYQFGEARMSVITSKKEVMVNPVEVICQYMDRLKRVRGNSKGFLFPDLRSTSNRAQ